MPLPRRWIRQLTYGACLLVMAAVLTLLANKNRIIVLANYVPADLTPLYFQPPSNFYVVDIALGNCLKLQPNCGPPDANAGHLGDVGEQGKWTRLEKDLLLGSSWLHRRFLSIKKVSSLYLYSNGGLVIVDIAVSDYGADRQIKGNRQAIPSYVLKEIHKNRVFNAEDHSALQEANKNEKLEGGNEKLENEDSFSQNAEKEAAKSDIEKAADAQVASAKEFTDSSAKAEFDELEKSGLVRRREEKSRHDLKGYYTIPTQEQLKKAGWKSLQNGIWAKYGPPSDRAVTGIDILFGPDAVDPRPNWKLIKQPLADTGAKEGLLPYLTIRTGPKLDYKSSPYQKKPKFNPNGKFKVLQVADLHFSTGVGKCRDPVPALSLAGCQADPRTLRFVEKVLDIEIPDFVVMTGDQVFGDGAPDPETALFKAAYPFVKRQIPFAITMGNHDDESIMSREQMMTLAASLPFSVAAVGPASVDGFGNYAVTVQSHYGSHAAAAMYFMDSHSYSKQPKTNPGYDWFKDSQIWWLEKEAGSIAEEFRGSKGNEVSMAFFHIPIQEFNNLDQPFIGKHREAVTCPRYTTDMRTAFAKARIHFAACGHDHANDYCLLDTHNKDTEYESQMWLCYGGGVGEGGYGGYGDYVRRMRVYEINSGDGSVWTWKRAENDPTQKFELQQIVNKGTVVNW